MKLFSDEYVDSYKKYFDIPKVIDEANKISDAVKNADKLNNDEKMASIILSYLKLQEYYGRNK